jgi:uncharacterized protein involved in propanediol utilization
MIGHGCAMAHHGELLQGMFMGPGAFPIRGLVTLPCQMYRSQAEFRPNTSGGGRADGAGRGRGPRLGEEAGPAGCPAGNVTVDPDWKWKARHAAELTLAHLGAEGTGGELRVSSTIPIGWGMGSSTSDVIAAIRATADGLGVALPAADVARLAVAAETASDSIMFGDEALLFAQRDALVIEDFGTVFPHFEVLGFAAGESVDTLGFKPAEYDDRDIRRFEELRVLLREGMKDHDPALVGYVATASSRINQRFLPKPRFDRILAVADAGGAAGVQVAHSGSVVGLLFDGDDDGVGVRLEKAGAALAELGFGSTWRFSTRLRTPDTA